MAEFSLDVDEIKKDVETSLKDEEEKLENSNLKNQAQANFNLKFQCLIYLQYLSNIIFYFFLFKCYALKVLLSHSNSFSRSMVTGPLFKSCTFMNAPNSPVSTSTDSLHLPEK